MIELINLSKHFRGIKAVDGIDLSVSRGTLFGFLGPNGAGKTTTIKMMAGILKPSAGRIVIDGKDLEKHPLEVKRCVGFIPDHPFLYEKLTGAEFLHFVGEIFGLDDETSLIREISRLTELFDLRQWQNELIESYSHGMKQRLAMCAALLHKPKILIVDEPMVGLDPRGAWLVKDVFKRESSKGTTVFMSTHSLEVAEEVCDEVAIIRAGKIIVSGSTERLKEKAGVDGNLEQIFLTLTEENSSAHATAPTPSET